MIEVREVSATDTTALGALNRMCQDTFDLATMCTPGAFWPSMSELVECADRGRVFGAYDAERPVGLATCTPSGHIGWLKLDPAYVAEAGRALTERVHADCGDCWGIVKLAPLREALAAANPRLVDDGHETGRLWWSA